MTTSQIITGAVAGAVLGGITTAAVCAMKTKKAESEDLGVENVDYLLADSQLSELVSRFRVLSYHSDELNQLYVDMVKSCNGLIECYMNPQMNKTKGALQFKANRFASAAKNNAIKLCKLSFSKHKDERSHELLREIDNLEGFCNNHLHNLMIE